MSAEKVRVKVEAGKGGLLVTMADLKDFLATYSTISASNDDDLPLHAEVNQAGQLTRLVLTMPGIAERQG